MKQLEFHPLAQEYDLLSGDDFAELCESIQQNGLDEDGVIVLLDGKILDGRNRYLACIKAGVKPRFRDFDPKRDGKDPAEFVRRRNDARRHDSPEKRQARRQQRIERVAEMRQQGMSTRDIAEKVGISDMQVREDIKAATAKGFAVEPEGGTVTGRDGRTRTAKPKKPEREPGEDDDAFDARDAKRDERRREANKQAPPKKDAIGMVIPSCQKDVFGDRILPETIACLKEMQEGVEFFTERIKRKVMHYPFVLVKDYYEHLGDAIIALQSASESLTAGIPYVVCPACKGEKCRKCRNAGHLPQWRYEELKEQEAMS